MPDNAKSVYAILDELKKRTLGISDAFPNGIEGQVISFLPMAESIHADDYRNPWTPQLTSGNGSAPPDPATVSAEVAKQMRNLANTCTLVDRKLRISNVFQALETGSKVSETWETIVKAAQIIPPDPAHAEAQHQQFETYHKRLRRTVDINGVQREEDTPEYSAYQEYQEKYYQAQQAYAAAYRTALKDPATAASWPVESQYPMSKVHQAWQKWTALGYKELIEKAFDQMSSMGTDPSAHAIARAKELFEVFSLSLHGGLAVRTPYVEIFPSNWCEPDQFDGWTTYSYSSSETNQASSAVDTTYSGSHGISWGFWNSSASASNSEKHEHNDLNVDGLEVSFSYALLNVNRPWLDTLLFDLDTWYLWSDQGGYPKGAISTGEMNQELPQNGAKNWLPIIPKQILAIKELSIKTTHIGQQFESLKSMTDADGNIGLGPFKLKGTYSNSETNQTFTADPHGETLTVKGVQILGWVSHLVQLSPKIDPPPIT